MWHIGVMVYMDCSQINFMHFYVHPKQPPVYADQFDVPYDLLNFSMFMSLYMWYEGVMVNMD
jgi:hypothetical protein